MIGAPTWRRARAWASRRRANPVAATLSDPWTRDIGTGSEWAPPPYGDYLATSPTLYACVDLRARNLGRVDLRAFQAGRAGAEPTPVDPSHPAAALFRRPNPHWSPQRFWYMVEASLCLWGSAPVAIVRDLTGQVRELWWLHPSRFAVVPHATQYIAGYLYHKAGQDVAFHPTEILWLRIPNPIDEYSGLSPLASVRQTIDTSNDAIRYNRRFFQNDGTPGRVYLKTDQQLTKAQADELRARWTAAFRGGPDKSHTMAVLDKNADLKVLALAQREMEFVEGQRFNKEEICGAFGISPILIGDLRNATLNNFRVAKSTFWDETMLPRMQMLESDLDTGLMPFLGADLVARFDTTEVSALREDANAKAMRYKLLIDSGIMTVDEIRAREGLPPRPAGAISPRPPHEPATPPPAPRAQPT